MGKVFERSKNKFGSARAAWFDVAKKTGLKPDDVESDHTRSKFVFKRK